MGKTLFDINEMRRLAERYFAGTISAAEEHELFRMVTTNADARLMLDEWRNEWGRKTVDNPEVDDAWRRLQTRIHQPQPIAPARGRRMSTLWRVAGVAAVFCLAFLGSRFYESVLNRDAVGYYTVTAQPGDHTTINLPDGTQVRLMETTTLTYPTNFNSANRTVELSGAAYFNVSRDEQHRFEVKVGDCAVVVKGTKFDISAYEEQSQIITTLLEGSVDFTSPVGQTQMTPGEALTYNCLTQTSSTTQIDTAQRLAWIEGRIEYVDVTIVELCESLSRLYGFTIELDDRLRSNRTYITIRLNNRETLDSVLKALDLIVPISVQRQGAKVRLSAKTKRP